MDIRLPLGLMFAIQGALLAGFGVATASSTIYREHSLGIKTFRSAGYFAAINPSR